MKPLLPSHLRVSPKTKIEDISHHDWLLGAEAVAGFFKLDLTKPSERAKFYRIRHLKKNPPPIHNVDVFGLSARLPALKAWLDAFATA